MRIFSTAVVVICAFVCPAPRPAAADLPGSRPAVCTDAIAPQDCNDVIRAAELPAEYADKYRITAVQELIALPGGHVLPNEAIVRFTENETRELPREISAGFVKMDGRWTRKSIHLRMNKAAISEISFETAERVWRFLKDDAKLLDNSVVTTIFGNRNKRIKSDVPGSPPVLFTVDIHSTLRDTPRREKKRLLYIGEKDGKLMVIENLADDSRI